MSKMLTRDQLSEAGVQFGHQTKRWNPKMKPYIYGSKNKNHTIDLQQTIWRLEDVTRVINQIGINKGKILFVGTKRSAKNAVKEAALRSGNFFVNSRWLGGTLTNMKTISSRIKALWDMEAEEKTGRLSLRPKKEQILIRKEKAKLDRTLGGIKQMKQLPQIMFVVDPKTDEIAVKEARKLRIPVIGICDTNVDPDMVDYVIPANDDLQESVNLIVNYIVDVYANAAQLKLTPSNLKVIAPKRDETKPFGNREFRSNNFRNNKEGFKPRTDNYNKDNKDNKDNINKENTNKEKPAFVKAETTEQGEK